MTLSRPTVQLLADVTAMVLSSAAAALALLDVHSPVRAVTVALALVVGTGWATTSWIYIADAAFAATVALATGLSIAFLYALFFVEIGWWHPVGSAGGLLIAAACLNGLAGLRSLRRRRSP